MVFDGALSQSQEEPGGLGDVREKKYTNNTHTLNDNNYVYIFLETVKHKRN